MHILDVRYCKKCVKMIHHLIFLDGFEKQFWRKCWQRNNAGARFQTCQKHHSLTEDVEEWQNPHQHVFARRVIEYVNIPAKSNNKSYGKGLRGTQVDNDVATKLEENSDPVTVL